MYASWSSDFLATYPRRLFNASAALSCVHSSWDKGVTTTFLIPETIRFFAFGEALSSGP